MHKKDIQQVKGEKCRFAFPELRIRSSVNFQGELYLFGLSSYILLFYITFLTKLYIFKVYDMMIWYTYA